MDEPLVTESLPANQPDYWVVQAKECFEYVRDFVSVLQAFKARDLVVESPFMGHAIWRAAWAGEYLLEPGEVRMLIVAAMYCHHVPKMDPSNALNSKLDPNAWDVTNQVLVSMRKKFRIANIYSKKLATDADYYTDKWKAWRINGGSPQSTVSENDGGLHEYSTKFETMHKQFGSLYGDETDVAYPNDSVYSKLSRLEHEEESREPHSPVVHIKLDGEESQRSRLTAISTVTSSNWTTVNGGVAAQTGYHDGNADFASASQLHQHHNASQAHQQQPFQAYPSHTIQSGRVSGFGAEGSVLALTEPGSQYGIHAAPFATSIQPNANGLSHEELQQRARNLGWLEAAGNSTMRSRDATMFEQQYAEYTNQSDYPAESMTQQPYMGDPSDQFDFYSNQGPSWA